MAAPPEICQACASPVQPGQGYCLDCGSRIVATPGSGRAPARLDLGLVAPAARRRGLRDRLDRREPRRSGRAGRRDHRRHLARRSGATRAARCQGPGSADDPCDHAGPAGAEAAERAHRMAPAERLHGRPGLDSRPRQRPGRCAREGDAGSQERPARRRRAGVVAVREPPPRVLRGLRRASTPRSRRPRPPPAGSWGDIPTRTHARSRTDGSQLSVSGNGNKGRDFVTGPRKE